jgi:hypothetical protein
MARLSTLGEPASDKASRVASIAACIVVSGENANGLV